MKIAGIILFVLGLIGTIGFGVEAIRQSEHMNIFGIQIAVSEANWTPVIISAIVLVVGVIMIIAAKGKTAKT